MNKFEKVPINKTNQHLIRTERTAEPRATSTEKESNLKAKIEKRDVAGEFQQARAGHHQPLRKQ